MKKRQGTVRIFAAVLALLTVLLGGCSGETVKLDPKNPVTITVWHYYNGAIMNAFEAMIKEFNDTVGLEKGVIVEGSGLGTVGELEKAVLSSANKETGSRDMPNIFASYADTAYEAEKLGILANLGDYFTKEEQAEYLDSYIEEGRIGLNGELRIFPVAKSTETLMVNDTDWQPFAEETGFTYDDLSTMEGVARVAAAYYQWTDAKTPDIPNDGKALWGRDSMANLIIIASKEFGMEIFSVENGTATMQVNADVMRKIWDTYYVPFISGHFFAYGRYRSDDAKVGDILGYVGSTSSASYFPKEVTLSGEESTVYSISAKVLPPPHFEGGSSVMVQQGAGMVVTKGTPQEEYASVLFLKWFTGTEKNMEFASLSGYMPVKKEAIDYDKLKAHIATKDIVLDEKTDDTLKVAIAAIQSSELYTNKAFSGGAAARSVLEYNLQDKTAADREAVVKLLESGMALDAAVAEFNTEEAFQSWLAEFTQKLNETIQ